jgi:biotin carboxyl carrier protein
MKKYIIKLNGKVYEVEMEEVTGEAATTMVESPRTQQTEKITQASGGETIEAPMPGNIFAIPVNVGDTVKRGQVVIVLEAMKMENEIVSPKDGKVVAVNVTKGQSVNAGTALVQIA